MLEKYAILRNFKLNNFQSILRIITNFLSNQINTLQKRKMKRKIKNLKLDLVFDGGIK